VTVISGKATAYRMKGNRETAADVDLTLIPYYAWPIAAADPWPSGWRRRRRRSGRRPNRRSPRAPR
jgi:hypothetical protein